jgi:hypothetical protein
MRLPPTDPEIVEFDDDAKLFWFVAKIGVVLGIAWAVVSFLNVIMCGII